MTRKCPFNGCDQRTSPNMFCCRGHWFSLSKTDRDTIWSAYRRYTADAMGIEELRRIQQAVLGTKGVA